MSSVIVPGGYIYSSVLYVDVTRETVSFVAIIFLFGVFLCGKGRVPWDKVV